jgi:aldehyde dehydrogenase (NAD+)
LDCGDVCVWKPSEKTPLCGIACQNIIAKLSKKITSRRNFLFNQRRLKVGEMMIMTNVPLISATGSTCMGKIVAQTVAGRLGRSLLN